MKEFRFLDQKRQTTGLSAEETARYAQLRDLVGSESGGGAARSGFDVGAAAARLRESLLPGGLRGAPPAAPPEPVAELEPEPEPEAAPEAVALEAAWNDQPFAPLEAAPEADPLFDPASLGAEVRPQAWNPDAPGYDPNAPYDEAAWIAAGYDPNATYDWSAYYGPDGQPVPAAEEAAEPSGYVDVAAAPEAAAWQADVGAEPIQVDEGPEAQGELPGEALADALTEAQIDAFAEPQVEVPAEPPFDAGAEPQAGAPAEPELPFDPNAPFDHAKWFGRPASQPAPVGDAAELEPEQPHEHIDLAAEALAPQADWSAAEASAPVEVLEGEGLLEPIAEPSAEAAGWPGPEQAPSVLEGAPDSASGGALAEPSPEPMLLPEEGDLAPAEAGPVGPAGAATPDSWFDASSEPPPAPALAFGDYDGDARGVPAGLAAMMAGPADLLQEPPPAIGGDDLLDDGSTTPYQPAPAEAPFGEYDEAASALPFDPAAASAIELGEVPEGYDPSGPVLDPATLPPPAPAFDDASYGGPEGDSLPGGAPLELGEPVQDWQPEQALEQGFQLASDGSFGELERPALTPVPGWAHGPATPPDGWESPPALDLAAPFDLESTAAHALPAEEAAPAEDLPTLAGDDLLEEVEPVAAGAPAEPEPVAPAEPEPVAVAAAPYDPAVEAAWAPPAEAEQPLEPSPEAAVAPALEPVLEPILEPVDAAAPAAFEPPPAVAAPAWEPPPAAEEIPPEIAAAFGDAPDTPAPATDPFAAAPAGWAQAEPVLPPLGDYAAPAAFEPPPAALFSEPPPVQGLSFGAGEPEPVLEEAPLAHLTEEPEPIVEPEPLQEAQPSPQVWIEGSHRVVLHTVDGQVKRGLLVDAALDALDLLLQPQGPGVTETVPTEGVKAIFFMLAPGEKAATPEGRKVRVTFRDGRQVAGYSPDYQEGTIGFFMIPADTRTNTGRIWVYQAAVRQVAVS